MSEEQTVTGILGTCSQKLVDVLRDGELPAESYSEHLDRLNSACSKLFETIALYEHHRI